MDKCKEHINLVDDVKELRKDVTDTREIVVDTSADVRWLKLDRQEQKDRYMQNRKHKLEWGIFFVMLGGLFLTVIGVITGVLK